MNSNNTSYIQEAIEFVKDIHENPVAEIMFPYNVAQFYNTEVLPWWDGLQKQRRARLQQSVTKAGAISKFGILGVYLQEHKEKEGLQRMKEDSEDLQALVNAEIEEQEELKCMWCGADKKVPTGMCPKCHRFNGKQLTSGLSVQDPRGYAKSVARKELGMLPKEEKVLPETVEETIFEAAKKHAQPYDYEDGRDLDPSVDSHEVPAYNAFIEGADWQQKKDRQLIQELVDVLKGWVSMFPIPPTEENEEPGKRPLGIIKQVWKLQTSAISKAEQYLNH